ncbi:MAG: adenylate kinase [Planctomycetes bacterium]|nr:adenylate kinase [Planctomycetota bacterium]
MTNSGKEESSNAIDLSRVLVLGSSCAGKTTFASELSTVIGAPHIELDSLHWGPNWTARPHDELAAEVANVAATDRWIVDGCYFNLQPILWPRATTAIWLNYSFPVVAWQAVKRTLRRSLMRERLYGDNRESLARALFSRESILLWVATSYPHRRQDIPKQLRRTEFNHLLPREFKHPRQASRFLKLLAQPSALRGAKSRGLPS